MQTARPGSSEWWTVRRRRSSRRWYASWRPARTGRTTTRTGLAGRVTTSSTASSGRRVGLGRDGDERVVGARVTRRQVRSAGGLDLVRGRREAGDANPDGRISGAGRHLQLTGSVLGGHLEGAVELVVAAVATARDEERPRPLVSLQQLGQTLPVAEAAPEQAAKVERRPGDRLLVTKPGQREDTVLVDARAPTPAPVPAVAVRGERPLVEVRRPALVERGAGRAPEQRVGATAAAGRPREQDRAVGTPSGEPRSFELDGCAQPAERAADERAGDRLVDGRDEPEPEREKHLAVPRDPGLLHPVPVQAIPIVVQREEPANSDARRPLL